MRTRLSGKSRAARMAMAAIAVVSLTGVALVVGTQGASAVSTGQDIVNEALSQSSYWYCEGGGGINGPSVPTGGNCPNGPGYDCMSLAQFAVYQETGITVPTNGEELPGGTDWDGQGTPISANDVEPGDVVFFGGSDIYHYAHSGIYAGNNEVVDALATGDQVGEHTISDLEGLYGQNSYWGGVRYTGSPPTLTITTSSLPNATVGKSYSTTLTTSGDTAPYKWKATGLPRGIHIGKKSGTVSGRVMSSKNAGSYTVQVTVTDSSDPSEQASASLGLTVNS